MHAAASGMVSEWREVELGELARRAGGFVRTGPFGSQLHQSDYTDDPSGVPVVMPKDMVRGRVDRASVSRVDDEIATRLGAHRLSPGDVVLARRGDVGRFAFIEPDEAGWLCGTGSMRVHAPDHSILVPRFLRYALGHPRVADWLVGQAVGATMPNLNAAIVEDLPLQVPGVATQGRVATILAAFDELIEINERRIGLLEDLARSLYREWFVRFRSPGHEHVDLVDSELGPIPREWEIKSVAAVAANERYAVSSGPFGSKLGRKDYREQGVPVIRGANLELGGGFHDDGFVFVEPSKADELNSSIARPGDIVVTQRGTLGQVGRVPANAQFERYVISQSQMKITVDPATGSPMYVYFVLRSSEASQRIVNMGSSSGVPHINLAALREMPILCPPRHLQNEFEQSVQPMMNFIDHSRRAQASVAATRDLLLPRLVTGRLDISDVDLGELLPAEAA